MTAEKRAKLEQQLRQLNNQRRDIDSRIRYLERPRRALGVSRPLRSPHTEDSIRSVVGERRIYKPGSSRLHEGDDGNRAKRRIVLTRGGKQIVRRRNGEGEEEQGTEEMENDNKEGEHGANVDKGKDEDSIKPTMVSSAVVTKLEEQSPRPQTKDKQLLKRNRRFFGSLRAHLGGAALTLKRERVSSQHKKKTEREARAEAKVVASRAEVRAKEQAETDDKKNVQLAAREVVQRKADYTHMLLLELSLTEHVEHMGNFLTTNCEPSICWIPAKHLNATQQALKQHSDEANGRLALGNFVKAKSTEEVAMMKQCEEEEKVEEANAKKVDKVDAEQAENEAKDKAEVELAADKETVDVEKKVDHDAADNVVEDVVEDVVEEDNEKPGDGSGSEAGRKDKVEHKSPQRSKRRSRSKSSSGSDQDGKQGKQKQSKKTSKDSSSDSASDSASD